MAHFISTGRVRLKQRLQQAWAGFKTLGLYRMIQEWLWWRRLSPAQRYLYEARMSDDWIIRNQRQ